MAVVTPLPLGGLGSEIGSAQQRLQLLQSGRSGVASLFYPTPVSIPTSTSQTWTVPSPWTLDVSVYSTNGVLVWAGCNIEQPEPVFDGTHFVIEQIGVGVDGGTPTILQANNAYGTGDLLAPGVIFPMATVGWIPPVGSAGPETIAMGSHTFSLQAQAYWFSGNAGSTTSVLFLNAFLVVVPL